MGKSSWQRNYEYRLESWKLDRRIESSLKKSKLEFRLTPFVAQEIVNRAVEYFAIQPITVSFSSKFRNCYGRAYYNDRKISLCAFTGLNVACLLHEIAHLMPKGKSHGPGFQSNLLALAAWFMED